MGNPRKRRDRLQIIAEILETARGGALKTAIMYKANLSFEQVNAYLSHLLEKDLLEAVRRDGETFYKATDKGLKFIQGHVAIRVMLRKRSQ